MPPAAAPKHGRKPPAEYDPSDGRTTIPPITASRNYGLDSVCQQLANLNDTSGPGFRYLLTPSSPKESLGAPFFAAIVMQASSRPKDAFKV